MDLAPPSGLLAPQGTAASAPQLTWPQLVARFALSRSLAARSGAAAEPAGPRGSFDMHLAAQLATASTEPTPAADPLLPINPIVSPAIKPAEAIPPLTLEKSAPTIESRYD